MTDAGWGADASFQGLHHGVHAMFQPELYCLWTCPQSHAWPGGPKGHSLQQMAPGLVSEVMRARYWDQGIDFFFQTLLRAVVFFPHPLWPLILPLTYQAQGWAPGVSRRIKPGIILPSWSLQLAREDSCPYANNHTYEHISHGQSMSWFLQLC